MGPKRDQKGDKIGQKGTKKEPKRDQKYQNKQGALPCGYFSEIKRFQKTLPIFLVGSFEKSWNVKLKVGIA